jgi:hypothetical protein
MAGDRSSGNLVLAALIFAVEEHKSKPMQAGRDFLVNANPDTMASGITESANSDAKNGYSPYTHLS